MCGLKWIVEGMSFWGVVGINFEVLNLVLCMDLVCGNVDYLVRCLNDVIVRYLMFWERWRGGKFVLVINLLCCGFVGRGGGIVVYVIDDFDV